MNVVCCSRDRCFKGFFLVQYEIVKVIVYFPSRSLTYKIIYWFNIYKPELGFKDWVHILLFHHFLAHLSRRLWGSL